MSSDKHGSFWVIDGLKVKRKAPFLVNKIERILIIETVVEKEGQPEAHYQGEEGEKYFFGGQYEDLADKKMDYGMIRFSSVNSLRERLFAPPPLADSGHNFSMVISQNWDVKRNIFLNQFVGFDYVLECEQQIEQEIDK